MTDKEFTIEIFKSMLADLFDADVSTITDDYDLAELIKDSIDLGELIATIKAEYHLEPADLELFKTETSLQSVFANFVPLDTC